MLEYDSVHYASSRLLETVIRKKDGEPIYVHAVLGEDKDILIHYSSLLGDKDNLQSVKLSDCDLNPLPLGYVNHGKNAFYVMRMPMRKDWRQGLRMMNITTPDGINPRNIPMRTIANTILNKYPSLTTCLSKISSNSERNACHSIAFHRDFSIDKEANLQYKGVISVASIDVNNGAIKIGDKFDWIREALNEALEVAA